MQGGGSEGAAARHVTPAGSMLLIAVLICAAVGVGVGPPPPPKYGWPLFWTFQEAGGGDGEEG